MPNTLAGKTVVLTGTFPELGGGAGQGSTLDPLHVIHHIASIASSSTA
jgi:hypothetical protein